MKWDVRTYPFRRLATRYTHFVNKLQSTFFLKNLLCNLKSIYIKNKYIYKFILYFLENFIALSSKNVVKNGNLTTELTISSTNQCWMTLLFSFAVKKRISQKIWCQMRLWWALKIELIVDWIWCTFFEK